MTGDPTCYVAGGGQQVGPLPASRVRALAHRLPADTQVYTEATGWVPLRHFTATMSSHEENGQQPAGPDVPRQQSAPRPEMNVGPRYQSLVPAPSTPGIEPSLAAAPAPEPATMTSRLPAPM